VTAAAKKRKPAQGFVVDVRSGWSRLDLSASGCKSLLRALEACGSTFDTAQLRVDRRDLEAIYLYLKPPEVKRMIARLKASQLGTSIPKKRGAR
jgi:hypothetical protein